MKVEFEDKPKPTSGWFVMLTTQRGNPVPLIDGDTMDPKLFDTEEEASKAADAHILGEAFGYEVFGWMK